MGRFKGDLLSLRAKNYAHYNCIYLYTVAAYKCFTLIKIHFGLIGDTLWKSGRVANAFEGFCLYLYSAYCVSFKQCLRCAHIIIQQVNLLVITFGVSYAL